jgi:hypothetical protein
VVDPSRFLLELPDHVADTITVTEEREANGLEDLPESPRYQVPSFVEDDDGDPEVEVN